jgi:predicted transcriptional regulator
MVTHLKKKREELGISAEALALEVGVSQAAISRVENGKAQASPRLADKLVRFLGPSITRDEILFPEYYDVDAPIRKPVHSAAQLQEAV